MTHFKKYFTIDCFTRVNIVYCVIFLAGFVAFHFLPIKALSQFVDYVYMEKEKDKITSLLTAILYHVWPHLSDHR